MEWGRLSVIETRQAPEAGDRSSAVGQFGVGQVYAANWRGKLAATASKLTRNPGFVMQVHSAVNTAVTFGVV